MGRGEEGGRGGGGASMDKLSNVILRRTIFRGITGIQCQVCLTASMTHVHKNSCPHLLLSLPAATPPPPPSPHQPRPPKIIRAGDGALPIGVSQSLVLRKRIESMVGVSPEPKPAAKDGPVRLPVHIEDTMNFETYLDFLQVPRMMDVQLRSPGASQLELETYPARTSKEGRPPDEAEVPNDDAEIFVRSAGMFDIGRVRACV